MYAVGLSNGGMFVNRLGCELSDRFAGIAFVVGPMPAPIARRCEPQKPISVLGIFGTADPLIPWRGGEVQGGDRGFILGAEETIELWARSNGCLAPKKPEVLPSQVDDGTVVKRTVYHGCKGGREVVLYAIEGGDTGGRPLGQPRGGLGSRPRTSMPLRSSGHSSRANHRAE
jgi:polyhydroxybutyrate depolymerase